MVNKNFWKGKKVFITGHTGFKGSWLTLTLSKLGSKVYGFSLKPQTKPNIFNTLDVKKHLKKHIIGDIQNIIKLKKEIKKINPQIVFHLAAQPLVRQSYKYPIETYQTNTIGTANILESCKNISALKSIIIITTDKCYDNKEFVYGYRETDALGGKDPYSSSKACAEILTRSYYESFFKKKVSISTVRAGNIIGGGDWSKDRLIPDIVKNYYKNKKVVIRNPSSTRPWQHVMEPVIAYLKVANFSFNKRDFENWNIGPNLESNLNVKSLIKLIRTKFNNLKLQFLTRKNTYMKESNFLHLDSTKIIQKLKWKNKTSLKKAISLTLDWYEAYYKKKNVKELTFNQINFFLNK